MKKLPKFSKTSWMFLSIGIFVVITGSLGLTYSQQLQEQEKLGGELGIAEKRISKLQVQGLPQKQVELQKRLDESLLQLAAAKDSLRQPVASINVTDEFYVIAYTCNVTVDSISSSNLRNSDMESISCTTITLNADVNGRLSDIIDFVTSLNNDFTTGIVGSTQLSITESSSNGETSANVRLTVYSYEGD